ncbi:hypothetical protein [uncultured Corynebacterium sp.]|jgi:hypothetical protein|nr:hypothetical protein [uncultured Corynebacterium sp.]
MAKWTADEHTRDGFGKKQAARGKKSGEKRRARTNDLAQEMA